ncbi:helix-turn-helix domain-containing protein [Flavobacterium psychrotrophum]|uniref:helix-turn-helix domain-containing protein n=1 Tax=Flavobacterium psychrotrophum TaxID=2294119 RepID=UPI000E31763E|nr:helix-turn-helix transcriptional regulator [Flavobacterium psychrotrophum]
MHSTEPNILIFIGTAKRTDKIIQKLLIAVVKEELEENIKLKTAASLRKLINCEDIELLSDSYNQIALAIGMRKGTVSDAFNANSKPSSSTLFMIIKAMGYSLSDFAKVYESLTDFEVNEFKKSREK